jgi:PKD repeat protein
MNDTRTPLLRSMPGALTLLLAGGLMAQVPQTPPLPCGHEDLRHVAPVYSVTQADLDAIEEAHAELEAFTQAFVADWSPGQRANLVIPVVFHIIHNGGVENISDQQIYDAMRILNEDFNKLNPDWTNTVPAFIDIVADVGIEFRLAQKDPQGNCTKGITRTQSPLTNDGTQTMKNLIQWPRNRYLNVWVAASANGAAGYTYRPGSVANQPTWDGIVLLHNYTGSIGTSSPYTSRTLTHEVGHWINLAHTWGNSNNPGLDTNCNGDDGVTDTPNTKGWTNCILNGESCGSLDNVQNYMEYSYCSRMFTNGQAARMIAALNSSIAQRSNLITAANLALTGVDVDGPLCGIEFSSDRNMVCQGATVQFSDNSFHGVTQRTWSFPGGTPATSTEQYPSVTYTEPGVYPVTLTVSDGTNTLEQAQSAMITVLADPGRATPAQDGFEDYASLDASPWTVENPDGDNTFVLTNVTSSTGGKSVRLTNTATMAGRTDNLYSETFALADAEQINISFRYAYAQRTSTNDDRLRLYVSSNCGETWSMRRQLRGNQDLRTGGTVGGDFVPNPEEWGQVTVNNISSSFHSDRFRIRFEFLSDGGNNVYIDDININGMPVSVGELNAEPGSGLRVVPNPASQTTQVLFGLTEAGPVRVELLDLLGRLIAVPLEGTRSAGPQRVDLTVDGLERGMYFVRLRHGARKEVVRLVVR